MYLYVAEAVLKAKIIQGEGDFNAMLWLNPLDIIQMLKLHGPSCSLITSSTSIPK